MIRRLPFAVLILTACVFGVEFNGEWLKKIPAQARQKTNPYENQPDAIASGRRVFLQHCSHCHGEDAGGNKKHPRLIGQRVQHATPGELHYLLVNGSMAKGMPPWSKLGDPQIWQLVTYLKSLRD